MSKYEVFSGPYFPAFSPNTVKYEPENAPYLDTFQAVTFFCIWTKYKLERGLILQGLTTVFYHTSTVRYYIHIETSKLS